jgi:hypothetical protein
MTLGITTPIMTKLSVLTLHNYTSTLSGANISIITLSIPTLSITTLTIITLGVIKLIISRLIMTKLSKNTQSIMKLGKATLIIKTLQKTTFSISVKMICCVSQSTNYAEWGYAKRHYAECRGAMGSITHSMAGPIPGLS